MILVGLQPGRTDLALAAHWNMHRCTRHQSKQKEN